MAQVLRLIRGGRCKCQHGVHLGVHLGDTEHSAIRSVIRSTVRGAIVRGAMKRSHHPFHLLFRQSSGAVAIESDSSASDYLNRRMILCCAGAGMTKMFCLCYYDAKGVSQWIE